MKIKKMVRIYLSSGEVERVNSMSSFYSLVTLKVFGVKGAIRGFDPAGCWITKDLAEYLKDLPGWETYSPRVDAFMLPLNDNYIVDVEVVAA